MSKPREINDLIHILKNISEKDSIKLSYIFNNLNKISNLYNLQLTEDEKRNLKRLLNNNYGKLKPFDINQQVRPKFDL